MKVVLLSLIGEDFWGAPSYTDTTGGSGVQEEVASGTGSGFWEVEGGEGCCCCSSNGVAFDSGVIEVDFSVSWPEIDGNCK